jgi:hypothetical protein
MQEPLESTRHCGNCGDRFATDFLCSALPAHVARPIPHRSSQFSRPAFFCRSFFWALLQANSCVRQLRGFCFPGSALIPSGSLPECSRSPCKQKPSLLGAPEKWGRKRRHFQVLMNSVTIVGFVGADPEPLGDIHNIAVKAVGPSSHRSGVDGHRFHRSAHSNCSKLLPDLGRIRCRIGNANFVESNE